MEFQNRRLQRESLTMQHMVELYCADHHYERHLIDGGSPCAACADFLAYADRRLEKCPYGDRKPTCARCPIHCYKQRPREFAKEVMRYAGPRMLWRHPWLSLAHLLDKLRRVEHPMAERRRERVKAEEGSGGA